MNDVVVRSGMWVAMDREQEKTDARIMLLVFVLALFVRGAVFLYVAGHPLVIFQPDSKMYAGLAQGLQQNGSLSSPEMPGQLDAMRMPGYPFFVSVILWILGPGFLPVVAVQIIIDSLSCVLVSCLSEKFWKGSAILSGIISSVDMAMITYAHFILSDSIFLMVFLFFLLRSLRFLDVPTWKNAVAVGLSLGVAGWIRPVIVYAPFVLSPFFFLYLLCRSDSPAGIAALKAGIVALFFFMFLTPWVVRNYAHWGKARLTAQSGEHLLQYIVPFVWQYSKGIPFIEGMKKVNEEFDRRVKDPGSGCKNADQFEVSDCQVAMALEYLKKEPKGAILQAWFFGMVKNLFSPAIIDLSYLLEIERPHFFHTKGKTTLERAWNFVKGIRGWFGWAVMGSLLALTVSRILQLWGVVRLMRGKAWECLFLLLIIGYFLLVSGPVGYAKYRLPFEPILIVLLAVGLRDLYGRWAGRAGGGGSEASQGKVTYAEKTLKTNIGAGRDRSHRVLV